MDRSLTGTETTPTPHTGILARNALKSMHAPTCAHLPAQARDAEASADLSFENESEGGKSQNGVTFQEGNTPGKIRWDGASPGYEEDELWGHKRHYAYSLGRFMSPDPMNGKINVPQSFNLYSYVMNNSLNFIDPFGLDTVTCTVDPGGGGETCVVAGDRSNFEAQQREAQQERKELEEFEKEGQSLFAGLAGRYGLFTSDWQQKFGAGYYWGTGYGQEAVDYYGDILADPESAWYEDVGAWAGGIPAAAWTENTYLTTYGTFLTGAALAGWASETGPWLGKVAVHGAHAGGPHQYPHLQIMIRGTKGIRIPVPQWFLKIFPPR